MKVNSDCIIELQELNGELSIPPSTITKSPVQNDDDDGHRRTLVTA